MQRRSAAHTCLCHVRLQNAGINPTIATPLVGERSVKIGSADAALPMWLQLKTYPKQKFIRELKITYLPTRIGGEMKFESSP